jgi:NAD-dependent SIR2 family protein deacetylase
LEPYEEDREERRKELTAAHRAIARLSLKGHVRVIVTANFDGLLESVGGRRDHPDNHRYAGRR